MIDPARRDAHSHVQDNGMAKRSYPNPEEATQVANMHWSMDGQPRNVYVCAQKPQHWHIGHGAPDLKTEPKP